MSERLHEQLSALLDGELPAGEAELLLVRLQRDPALRATLARYTVAGDAIRIASLQAAAQVEPVEQLLPTAVREVPPISADECSGSVAALDKRAALQRLEAVAALVAQERVLLDLAPPTMAAIRA